MNVTIVERTGAFAENKDAGRRIRLDEIDPLLDTGAEVSIDFAGVELATQSFVHALISALIRSRGAAVLDQLLFINCNETVQRVIEIVVEYSQDDVST